jgi:hypothetical protein
MGAESGSTPFAYMTRLFMGRQRSENTGNAKGRTMTTVSLITETPSQMLETSIQPEVERAIDDLMASLPNPKHVSSDQRRGIIARYSAVLEGNFIYWMTGAYLALNSEDARAIIWDNLHEEVRDSHPRMLRKFTIAARAIPTDQDAIAVDQDLTNVRLFIGRLSPVRIVVMMAFFEGFIQKFMAYLAELAAAQGSTEFEYTDVHGVCDIAHTEGLYRALATEMSLHPAEPAADLLEGVHLLRALIQTMVEPDSNRQ